MVVVSTMCLKEIHMRRMILTTLVLLPVMARAQAGTATEPQPSTSSANVQAELTKPAGLAELAAAAAASAPATVLHAASPVALHESIRASYGNDFLEAALRQGGTLEYSMKGSVPAQVSAPQVTRAVEIGLSPQELSEQPAVSSVVVRAIVDEYGIPRNVAVTQSAGPLLDQKAVAAVSQYRFKPAMVDNKATWATVSIAIKIQKQ